MSNTQGNKDQSEFGRGDVPRDPALAGFVGKRRASYGDWPDPEGNRSARRSYAKIVKRAARKSR